VSVDPVASQIALLSFRDVCHRAFSFEKTVPHSPRSRARYGTLMARKSAQTIPQADALSGSAPF